MPPVEYQTTILGGGVNAQGVAYPGGLDLTTPSLSLRAGALRDGINVECSQAGGYARIQGYERCDGRAKPSSASYQIVQLTGFVNVPALGQSVTQATSGATGTIIAINNAVNAFYIAITQVTGTFDTTHNVSVGATLIGTAAPLTAMLTAKTNAIYTAAAADVYRALIGTIPGSGKVLGVVHMIFSGADQVYALRANIGGSAVNLYKQTPSGWTQVPFYNSVSFNTGTATGGAGPDYEPPDGTSITQGGVTATVKRVVWASGTFANATHTAAGTLVITAPSGGNFAAGTATLGDGTTVNLLGAQTAISLAPGGRFEFVKANFSGQPSTRRIYACDGVNQCAEFDGDVWAPIATGLSPDQPSNIGFHKNYLIIGYGGSILGSAPGLPFKWTATDGAWEIACGDTVTGFTTVPGSQTTATLAVFLRYNSSFLYGTDPTTFNLTTFNNNLGAIPYSVQNLFDTFFFDDLGIVNMKTTLNWGNFLPTSLTKNILPFIIAERGKITASTINRSKSQYRVFFSDGFGLYLTMINQDYLGVAKVAFPNPVFVADNDTDSLGNEVTYFASTDAGGYVYQLDSGTGFDGQSLNWYATLAWDPIKSPRIKKRFRAAVIEMQGSTYAEIQFGYQLGYGTPNIAQPSAVTYPSGFVGAPNWDSGINWDSGVVWDGLTLFPTYADMTGRAENVQYTLAGTGNYSDAFTLNSIITHFSPGRGKRD